jgi:hypothetical protein
MIERSAFQSLTHATDPGHSGLAPQTLHPALKQPVVLHNDPQYGIWVDNGSGPLLAILALDLGNHDSNPQDAASRLPKQTILFDCKVS